MLLLAEQKELLSASVVKDIKGVSLDSREISYQRQIPSCLRITRPKKMQHEWGNLRDTDGWLQHILLQRLESTILQAKKQTKVEIRSLMYLLQQCTSPALPWDSARGLYQMQDCFPRF